MSLLIDLTGRKFGRLTVVGRNTTQKWARVHWNCVCECGSKKQVPGILLTLGVTKSCGCYRRDLPSFMFGTHRKSTTREYGIWCSMLSRCNNPNVRAFKNYGARSIKVCKRWHKFENFISDMGERPSIRHSVERKDNSKGYGPRNCKWATAQDQARNKRTSIKLTFDGKTMPLSVWADHLKQPYLRLYNRLRLGWKADKILTYRIQQQNKAAQP